jgi:hypothetical protein
MGRKKTNTADKTFSVRWLSEKEEFAMTFWAQHRAQSGSAWLNHAALDRANKLGAEHKIKWETDVWHEDPIVRTLQWYLLEDTKYPFTKQQHAERTFIMRHIPFFYDSVDGRLRVSVDRAVELYPLLKTFRKAEGDHWAPARAMVKHLKERGLAPPAWRAEMP